MNKLKILSSTLIMTMASFSALAEDAVTNEGKITGGAGTCTVDILGVSDNNATANTIAVWEMNKYILAPGEYLSVSETSVDKTTCPAGSYCVGGTDFTVENASTSITACPTDYPNSATGAGAQNQCYTACTVNSANIAHATAVAGNDYFGDGTDTCYATGCDTGYHVNNDIQIIEKDPLIPVDYQEIATSKAYITNDGKQKLNDTEHGLTKNGTWSATFSTGTVYGHASCQPTRDPGMEYLINNMNSVMTGSMDIDVFENELAQISGKHKANFATNLLKGLMNGTKTEEDMLIAMQTVFVASKNTNFDINDTGQHCYCQLTGFIATNGTKTNVLSAPWLYNGSYGSAESCAEWCAEDCNDPMVAAADDLDRRAYRAVSFGVLDYIETGECAANTINIDWNPDNGGEHTQNQCVYDGAVTLPTPDPVKPGYTFTGWKLVESETTTD